MEEINYLKRFEQQFYPAVKYLLKTGPVVLFFDGHFSHMSISLIKRARSLGIHLFCLLPTFGCRSLWVCENTVASHLEKIQNSDKSHEYHKGAVPQPNKAAVAEVYITNPFAIQFPSYRISTIQSQSSEVFKNSPLLSFGRCNTSSSQQLEIHATLIIHGETPLRTELRGYFSEVLKPTSCTTAQIPETSKNQIKVQWWSSNKWWGDRAIRRGRCKKSCTKEK